MSDQLCHQVSDGNIRSAIVKQGEPSHRRRGFSRAVMKKLIVDSVERHKVDMLILFTGEKNVAARNLYEGLGLEHIGFYGIFFGTVGAQK